MRTKAKVYKIKHPDTRFDESFPWRMVCCGITTRAYPTWTDALRGVQTHNYLKHSRLRKL